MTRAIGMVDAGYLLRTTSAALKMDLAPFDLDPVAVRNWFRHSAARIDSRLLRTLWYDGALEPGAKGEPEQRKSFSELEETGGIRLRLGHMKKRPNKWQSGVRRALRECGVDIDEFKKHYQFRDSFEQKGVDTLLVLDMMQLGQQNAYQTLFLIAGDSDLAGAVRAVQDIGKEVIVACPDGLGLSPELRRVADQVVFIRDLQLRRLLKSKPGLASYEDETGAESD